MGKILSISEANLYIKNLIGTDPILSNLWIKGEISNYKNHSSGHLYLTLKDEKSVIKAVMFRSWASLLRFVPENGLRVIVRGYVSVFERDGQYQLYVEEMQPDGIGSLHLAFEQLKKKLEIEGLFDTHRKKKIPFLPRSIGVVTSPTGAVIRDIIQVVSRRYPNIDLKLMPVAVQGTHASTQIAHAIERFNRLACVDVIIVARGGGSLEELWAFNEEAVARSIVASHIPVISAVGHETDFTICDFVADLRAPTPSAAAELVVPEKQVLEDTLFHYKNRLQRSLRKALDLKRLKLSKLQESTVFRQPFTRVWQERMRLDTLQKYLQSAQSTHLSEAKARFSSLVGKLHALSPLNVLARGYAVVKSKDQDRCVQSIKDTREEEKLEIQLKDGVLACTVNEVKER